MPDTTPSESKLDPARPSAESARPTAGGDWTVVATERIEALVGTLRDRTTVPVTKIVRGLVFGLIIAVMGVLALVLGVIGLLRLHVYWWFQPEARKVWVTYVGLGAIFMLAGAFAWRKRTVRAKE